MRTLLAIVPADATAPPAGVIKRSVTARLAVLTGAPTDRDARHRQIAGLAETFPALLPVAGGAADTDAMHARIAREETALLAALAQLAGRVEAVLTADAPAPDALPSTGGHLRAVARRKRADKALCSRLTEQLEAAVARAEVIGADRRVNAFACRGRLGVDLSLLLPAMGAASAIRRLTSSLADGELAPPVAVRASGPWPCYSFVPRLDLR
ncbi:MAG: GvpL/GvpF family gas vesicle protein [Paracoccaceae bacterium]